MRFYRKRERRVGIFSSRSCTLECSEGSQPLDAENVRFLAEHSRRPGEEKTVRIPRQN